MVARGFGQINNVDFSETFAPTPSAGSVKIAVAMANEKGRLLRHLGVMQSFTQVHLNEAVYMRLPAGCGDMSGEVVLLQRAVYDFDKLIDNGVCVLVECSCRKFARSRERLTRVCSIRWWMGRLPSLYVFMLTT